MAESNGFSLKKLIPPAFRNGLFLKFKGRYRAFKGARNTGKSHTIIGWESLLKIFENPLRNILVVRLNSNSNRQSTYENICGRIYDLGLSDRFSMVQSPSPEITYLPTGQKIVFKGMNDPSTLNSITFKHGYLTDVYIEEAFEIASYADFRKLDFSLRGKLPDGLFLQITLCFNAWSKDHWIYERFFKDNLEDDFNLLDDPNVAFQEFCDPEWQGDFGKGLYLNTSTYKANPYRDSEIIDSAAKAMRERSLDIYKVEYLGMWGNSTASTYAEFTDDCLMTKQEIASKYRFRTFAVGLDTGYSNGEGGRRIVGKNQQVEERVKAAHALILCGVTDDCENLVLLDEYYHSEIDRNGHYNTDEAGQIGIAQLLKRTADYVLSWEKTWRTADIGLFSTYDEVAIYIDGADVATAQMLQKEFEMRGINYVHCYRATTKLSVQNRVDFEKTMMAWGNFKVCTSCKNLIREIRNCRRDPKGRARMDIDDHAITAAEYGFTPLLGDIHQWKQFKER